MCEKTTFPRNSEVPGSCDREDRGPTVMPIAEEGEAAPVVARGGSPLCGRARTSLRPSIPSVWEGRWFIFHPQCCRLTYHKGPQEPALGSIDTSEARFGFSPEEEEGLLHIRSGA